MLSGDLEERLEQAYLAACECELQAFKPGNVSVYSESHDMTVDDFRRSAQVSAPSLTNFKLSLGEKMFYAIRATRAAVGCNTNLGIVLLCGPLIQSMQPEYGNGDLQTRLERVLRKTTREDAIWVYRAIRLAKPGGLGRSPEQDVSGMPDVSLLDAMRIASDRDRIAYQYISGYQDIFDFAITRHHAALNRWNDESWAALAVFVGLLRRHPDSHVVRKFGRRFTEMVQDRMASLEKALSHSGNPERLLRQLQEVNDLFKSAGINPGATADLTVACLLVVRLERLLAHC
jgi:triphosphoribosyl-dephospho-CoA synthase